jgi:hypothetical protein
MEKSMGGYAGPFLDLTNQVAEAVAVSCCWARLRAANNSICQAKFQISVGS